MVQRVTKQQAMVSMGISSSTLERRIKSGEVQVEVDHAGSRRRVWVVVDDDPADEPPGIQHDIQHPTGDTQVVVMQVKLDNALALAEYRAELRKLRNSPCHPGFADNYLSSNGNRNCPLAGPAACPGCEQVGIPGLVFWLARLPAMGRAAD